MSFDAMKLGKRKTCPAIIVVNCYQSAQWLWRFIPPWRRWRVLVVNGNDFDLRFQKPTAMPATIMLFPCHFHIQKMALGKCMDISDC
jgi:hypothetical protein